MFIEENLIQRLRGFLPRQVWLAWVWVTWPAFVEFIWRVQSDLKAAKAGCYNGGGGPEVMVSNLSIDPQLVELEPGTRKVTAWNNLNVEGMPLSI